VRPRPLPEAERLEPIGLESLDATAALRRRFDAKYLLSRVAVVELLGRLEQTHRVLDIDGLRDFEYRTTYFDTRELRAFRDHMQGRRRRLKTRVRHYAQTGACFFELKLRGPRESTIKRRLPHAVGLRHPLTPESLATLERWLREAYGRPAPSPLAPALDVAFRRTTLVAPERGERLTIDVDLLVAYGNCQVIHTTDRTTCGADADLPPRTVEMSDGRAVKDLVAGSGIQFGDRGGHD
jgi:VTC domain